jgi:predicted N-formylglutamate amidohydrolase
MPDAIPPVVIHGEARASRWLVTCDHASNRVPPETGALGISAEDMARHIAWDVGAAGVATALADALGCPCAMSTFSRLVIDPNRGEDDPTLVMRLYDGTVIPGNARIDAAGIAARLDALHRPYHAALARLAGRRADTVIVAVHSFTPCLRGRAPRPWHVGVLWSPRDPRLSQALLARLHAEPDLCVGANQPYNGHLPGDSIDRHALDHGRHNTLVEIRNDLIADPGGQRAWGQRLAPILRAALADLGAG